MEHPPPITHLKVVLALVQVQVYIQPMRITGLVCHFTIHATKQEDHIFVVISETSPPNTPNITSSSQIDDKKIKRDLRRGGGGGMGGLLLNPNR
jgi:hypothetical protein